MKDNRLERLIEAVQALKRTKKVKTNAEIAEKLGYTRPNTISDILNGRQTLTDKFLISFSNAYPISLQWLQEGVGDMLRELTKEEETTGYKKAAKKLVDALKRKPGTVSGRIREAVTTLENTRIFGTRSDILRMIGIQDETLLKNEPPEILVNVWANMFTDKFGISSNWLRTGEGEMYLPAKHAAETDAVYKQVRPYTREDLVNMKHQPGYAEARKKAEETPLIDLLTEILLRLDNPNN